jgi:hypothetical protein
MNLAKKSVVLVAMSALLAAGLCACDRGDTPGEALDKGLSKAGDKVKEAGEAIKPK